MKKSNLYTRTGDNGLTSLVSGNRVGKDSTRIEAYGTIDELNSHIGLLAAIIPDTLTDIPDMLRWIQNKLFDLGSYLATDPDEIRPGRTMPAPPSADDIAKAERMIDSIDSNLPPFKRFVLPGGAPSAAQAHVARTVCRRAERRIIALSRSAAVAPEAVQFINRLSDLLFAASRLCNLKTNHHEIFWDKNC